MVKDPILFDFGIEHSTHGVFHPNFLWVHWACWVLGLIWLLKVTWMIWLALVEGSIFAAMGSETGMFVSDMHRREEKIRPKEIDTNYSFYVLLRNLHQSSGNGLLGQHRTLVGLIFIHMWVHLAAFNRAHQYQNRVIKIPQIENWCSRGYILEYGDSSPEMAWVLAWVEAIVTDRPTDDGLLFLFNKILATQICGSASQESLCLESLVNLAEWNLHAYELYTIILHLSKGWNWFDRRLSNY